MTPDFLASAAIAGIPPESFLKAKDDLEIGFLALVAKRAIELYEVQQKNQAAYIINFLGKALGDKKTKPS